MADVNIKAVISAEDKASATLAGFTNSLDAAKAGSLALLAGLTAMAAGAAYAVKVFGDNQAIIAQLNQVLETTGKASSVSSDQVQQLAQSLERYSGQSHDAIEQGQVLLLQFAQTTKQTLPEMSKAMVDLAQRMGVDTVTAAKQLGIALDDPTTGMARLRRSGIDFTAAQKEAIKSMQESGDLAGADALLMKSLEEKVGGAAGAFRNTLPGSVAAAKQSVNDMTEAIGGMIAKGVQPLIESFNKWVDAMGGPDKIIEDLTKKLEQLQPYFPAIVGALIGGLVPAFVALASSIWLAISPLLPFLAIGALVGIGVKALMDNGINPLKGAVNLLTEAWDFLRPSVLALWSSFEENLLPSLKRLWEALAPVLVPVLRVLGELLGAEIVASIYLTVNALNVLIKVISTLINWAVTAGGAIVSAFKTAAAFIVEPYRIAFDAIASLWNGTVGKIHFKAPDWVPGLGNKEFGIPQVPLLAEGAIVTKPTLAMIGEAGPEAVVPLGKGLGQTVNVTFNGVFTGSQQEFRKLAIQVFQAGKDAAGAKSMSLGEMFG